MSVPFEIFFSFLFEGGGVLQSAKVRQGNGNEERGYEDTKQIYPYEVPILFG